MAGYGQTDIAKVGADYRACASPQRAGWKHGGLTIDWTTVTAVGSDTTLADGTVVKSGDKYIICGTILTRITSGGKFGPADTSVSDGRQLVTAVVRGDCYILDRTVVKSELGSDIIGCVFDSGAAYKSRLQMGGSNQPTEANVEVMLPAITFVTN